MSRVGGGLAAPPLHAQVALLYARPHPLLADPLERARRLAEHVVPRQQAVLLVDGWVAAWAAWWRLRGEVLAGLRWGDLEATVARLVRHEMCHGPHVYVHAAALAPWAPAYTGAALWSAIRRRNPDAVSFTWQRDGATGARRWISWRPHGQHRRR